jgi:hypothetical protein
LAEYFNWLSKHVNDFGFVEKEENPWLSIKIYWGRVFVSGGIWEEVADDSVELDDDLTSYIVYDTTNKYFLNTTSEPTNDAYITIAKVVTAGWDITSIDDYRQYIIPWVWWSSGWGWHEIKNTDQGWTTITLTQRATLLVKKMKATDDPTWLQTIIEWKRLWTPDVIAAWETEYIEEDTQMVIEWWITVDGTLVNDWKLVIL